MRRGRQARVLTPGSNGKRGVFGALALVGPVPATWHSAVTERKRAVEFLAFLEQFVAAYPRTAAPRRARQREHPHGQGVPPGWQSTPRSHCGSCQPTPAIRSTRWRRCGGG